MKVFWFLLTIHFSKINQNLFCCTIKNRFSAFCLTNTKKPLSQNLFFFSCTILALTRHRIAAGRYYVISGQSRSKNPLPPICSQTLQTLKLPNFKMNCSTIVFTIASLLVLDELLKFSLIRIALLEYKKSITYS